MPSEIEGMEFALDGLTALIMMDDRNLTYDEARAIALKELKKPW